jgi:hypothetical protein
MGGPNIKKDPHSITRMQNSKSSSENPTFRQMASTERVANDSLDPQKTEAVAKYYQSKRSEASKMMGILNHTPNPV